MKCEKNTIFPEHPVLLRIKVHIINECSNRSMEVYLPSLLGNYDRPTDQQTDVMGVIGKFQFQQKNLSLFILPFPGTCVSLYLFICFLRIKLTGMEDIKENDYNFHNIYNKHMDKQPENSKNKIGTTILFL